MTSKTNPYADLVASIKKAIGYSMPLKLYPMNKDGDVCFTVPWNAFAWSDLTGAIFRSSCFADLIGEILVRSHLHVFDAVIASKLYPEGCAKFRHTGFGLKIFGQDVLFFLHCSYLVRIFNQFLSAELEEAQKEIVDIHLDKKKQSDDVPSIVSDGKSFKVIISRQNLEHSISTAVSAILEHYGVSKDVRVTMGQFQMELETVDL